MNHQFHAFFTTRFVSRLALLYSAPEPKQPRTGNTHIRNVTIRDGHTFKDVTMSLFECYTRVNGMVCHIVVKVPYLNVP